ncbi:MAG: hypothetical protein A4E65_00795 [Syntrophorhabdus sp. PtaU1.Bin153]|nr:MAG: hypothetical protein A4E65_00795 [Syntrophorhabdus sp. PtaU1.Bin153]
MPIRYLNFSIAIHGMEIEDKDLAVDYLKGWLREATYAALMGNNKELFKFRNEFDSDIEVELEESAGK